MIRLYRHILNGVVQGKSESEIIPTIAEEENMAFLKPIVDPEKGIKQDFSTERKSAVFLGEALKTSLRCSICSARLHRVSMHIDHSIDKKFGGLASDENANIVHPYCDSTYKEWKRAQAEASSTPEQVIE